MATEPKRLQRLISKYKARRAYRRVSDHAERVTARLYTTRHRYQRYGLLKTLSELFEELAMLHPVAFGPDPGEGGRDVAESLGSSAILIRTLAATERQVAMLYPDDLEPMLDHVGPAESALWRKLATTSDPAVRAELILQVSDLAALRVGGKATESLTFLAETEKELARAAAEGRAPVRPVALTRSRRVVIAMSIIAVVVLWLYWLSTW
jgi:hypothetical protein